VRINGSSAHMKGARNGARIWGNGSNERRSPRVKREMPRSGVLGGFLRESV
jgi:hypothetical protein